MDAKPDPAIFAPLTVSKVAGTICAYCHLSPPYTGTTKLSRCTTCKRASYCGPKCQKADWKFIHKKLCKKFVQMNEYERSLEGRGKMTRIENAWHDNRRWQMFSEPSADDPYGAYNKGYMQDQPKCNICFRNPFMSEEYYTLTTCTRCTLAWHCPTEDCSTDFKKIHSRSECGALVDYAAVERMKIDYAISRQSIRQLMVPAYPARSYFPLSTVRNWEEYCRRHFTDFHEAVAGIAQDSTLSRMNPHAVKAVGIMAKQSASIPLTMVASLEKVIPDLSSRRRLCVHIVGASEREASGKGMMEEVLHLLPSCQCLTVGYIGPEAIVHENEGELACSMCQGVGKTRNCIYFKGPYHDFLQSSENTKPADFIICFNTGMSEVERASWAPTLKAILDLKIPAAFTSYSQPEIRLEKILLDGLGANFVLQPERNRWKGVIPILNTYPIAETNEKSWSYANYYWYIIRGRRGPEGPEVDGLDLV